MCVYTDLFHTSTEVVATILHPRTTHLKLYNYPNGFLSPLISILMSLHFFLYSAHPFITGEKIKISSFYWGGYSPKPTFIAKVVSTLDILKCIIDYNCLYNMLNLRIKMLSLWLHFIIPQTLWKGQCRSTLLRLRTGNKTEWLFIEHLKVMAKICRSAQNISNDAINLLH